MAMLTEDEGVLILVSLRKYRGIIRFTCTPKLTIQAIDQLVDKLQDQINPSTNGIKHIRKVGHEAHDRNGYDCDNCE